ncbi:16S rRNA (cytosine(1402)-N(4))-methyltransferase RsmH [Patescibacteria group bacterium]|nr:16S rRNA (cytosine(1402)-N(4))-methyltransferase RsmH [Patescibacteria group bacterium]
MESIHRTVLLNEIIEGLNLQNNSLILDCTFGGGGHSLEVLLKKSNTKIIALDQDSSVWEKAKGKFKGLENRITFVNTNFKDLDKVSGKVDGIIFDLGLSSDQLENSGRGFSFLKDEPLFMTMKENPQAEDLTAMDVVNLWNEENLADIIYGYGEEKFSRRIAKGIVEARKKGEIKTTFDLVKIIEKVVPAIYRRGRINPATKTFQALRIAVNDELGALKEGLEKGFNQLKVGGRMSVISFHSLEDRITKKFYKNLEKEGKAKLINKKPIIADSEELKNNPRARSAKLRILEKV